MKWLKDKTFISSTQKHTYTYIYIYVCLYMYVYIYVYKYKEYRKYKLKHKFETSSLNLMARNVYTICNKALNFKTNIYTKLKNVNMTQNIGSNTKWKQIECKILNILKLIL